MANNRIPVDKILRIRELWDDYSIHYIATRCQISRDTVKKYGQMTEYEAIVLIEALMEKQNE